MRRLRFDVAYDGTDYHGWQVQPGLSTIQGVLEEIISVVEGKRVHVSGSGRTDAGVHAFAQVASVSIENRIPTDNFRRAVNRLLPINIRISNVREVPLAFHPRFDASRKTYEFRIFREEICSPFLSRFVFHHPFPLNEKAMMQAAPLLIGEYDFTAFAAADDRYPEGQTNVRIIFRSEMERTGDTLIYRVTGSGFLKHMVRNIMGVLFEVGKGNLHDDDIRARLQPNNGIRPGPRVPACGLILVSVEYDDDQSKTEKISET
jgi:tRNA pseudouridine38-40 synthase